MSIKSTVYLTREEAESQFRKELAKRKDLSNLSNTVLEDWLEILDEESGNEFTNYIISEEEED